MCIYSPGGRHKAVAWGSDGFPIRCEYRVFVLWILHGFGDLVLNADFSIFSIHQLFLDSS